MRKYIFKPCVHTLLFRKLVRQLATKLTYPLSSLEGRGAGGLETGLGLPNCVTFLAFDTGALLDAFRGETSLALDTGALLEAFRDGTSLAFDTGALLEAFRDETFLAFDTGALLEDSLAMGLFVVVTGEGARSNDFDPILIQ